MNNIIGTIEDSSMEVIVEIKGAGPQGEQGVQGDTGEQGPKGDPGIPGEKGDPFRFEDFTMEQLESISADKHYVHKQTIASKEWYMYHPLKKFPSVSIIDSAGTEWIGVLEYLNDELVVAKFSAEMSGKAFLN